MEKSQDKFKLNEESITFSLYIINGPIDNNFEEDKLKISHLLYKDDFKLFGHTKTEKVTKQWDLRIEVDFLWKRNPKLYNL